MSFLYFVRDGIGEIFRGSAGYWGWISALIVLTLFGAGFYVVQLQNGLIVTGMSDQVSWGFYIANFTFLVGIAAAAVLLVIPAYVFHREDVKVVVVVGEAIAVAAVVMAMTFVIIDLGRPDRMLHLLPVIGRFNFPSSLLAWDVVVLFGYLALNLLIPGYLLYRRYQNREPATKIYFPLLIFTIFWAISIHTVTAFLFSGNPGRPLWHTAILGPRFIASAFVSGPALIIVTLALIRRVTSLSVRQSVVDMLALIMAVSLQINVFFVAVELFTDFYNEGSDGDYLRYLYFGLHGADSLITWIWPALAMNLVALGILMIHRLRRRMSMLYFACGLAFVGVWIEKGMGMVVPGFIPTTLGEVFEYSPTWLEINVSIGIWALGLLIFTLLVKPAIAVQVGKLRLANHGN